MWLPHTLPAKHHAAIYISHICPPSPLPLSPNSSTRCGCNGLGNSHCKVEVGVMCHPTAALQCKCPGIIFLLLCPPCPPPPSPDSSIASILWSHNIQDHLSQSSSSSTRCVVAVMAWGHIIELPVCDASRTGSTPT